MLDVTWAGGTQGSAVPHGRGPSLCGSAGRGDDRRRQEQEGDFVCRRRLCGTITIAAQKVPAQRTMIAVVAVRKNNYHKAS